MMISRRHYEFMKHMLLGTVSHEGRANVKINQREKFSGSPFVPQNFSGLTFLPKET